MNKKMIGKLVGVLFFLEALFMLPAIAVCFIYGETGAPLRGFLWTVALLLALSGALYGVCAKATREFYAKEGFIIVALGWILLSAMGALPFYISGEIPHYVDAFFETVSGFTTTGASVLTDVEAMSHGLLYWRSFTHWLGGMGMLVFLLAVVPTGKGAGYSIHLLRAESPGPSVGKMVPRMRQTASLLYKYTSCSPSCAYCFCWRAACPCSTACARPSVRRARVASASKTTAWRITARTCRMCVRCSWRCSA